MIAIDIALLPSDDMLQKIVDATSDFSHEEYPLQSVEKYIPHITLRQGYMKEEDVLDTIKEMQSLNLHSFTAQASSTYEVVAPGTQKNILCLEIEKSKELLLLHEAVMRLTTITQEGSGSFFDIAIPDMDHYIRTFAQQGAYEKFRPHITLGEGTSVALALPITFRASRVAICHLGKWWTCAKILGEYQLR